ncbi:MAG: hypothetical protein WHU94_08980 [Thermogemmata sp.]
MLEERVGGETTVQYVWSPVYVDALILRDRDSDGDGTLDERLWVAQDANFNVTALVDDSGNVVERYIYDPFGQATVLDAEWNVRSGGSAYDWHYLLGLSERFHPDDCAQKVCQSGRSRKESDRRSEVLRDREPKGYILC